MANMETEFDSRSFHHHIDFWKNENIPKNWKQSKQVTLQSEFRLIFLVQQTNVRLFALQQRQNCDWFWAFVRFT